MTHEPLYKTEKINIRAWGVYKRDFGSSGGWVLIKAYATKEEAEASIYLKLGGLSSGHEKLGHPLDMEP